MRARTTTFSLAAILTIVASLVAGAPAGADIDAAGLEEVASIAVDQATHLEFMEREINGVTHTYALVGSRSADAPPEAGTGGGGLNVIDVTDPEAPVVVGTVGCRNTRGAVDPKAIYYDTPLDVNGVFYDTLIAFSYNDSLVCVVDGEKVFAVSFAGVRTVGDSIELDFLGGPIKREDGQEFRGWKDPASHTVVAHPSRPILYAGNQALADRAPSVEIIDVSQWPPVATSHAYLPSRVTTGAGPHDITFSPDGNRAYVSAITISMIWDTTGDKVLAPELIGFVEAPNLKVHHEAVLHPNGRHLMVVDETIASSSPTNVPVCPGGGFHVFDLGPNRELEAAPVPVGQFYAPDLTITMPVIEGTNVHNDISCTAHEFNIAPDGDSLTIGWYAAGTRRLDISSFADAAAQPVPTPVTMSELGHYRVDGNEVWSAKTPPNLPGYVFVSDTGSGMFRVLSITA